MVLTDIRTLVSEANGTYVLTDAGRRKLAGQG